MGNSVAVFSDDGWYIFTKRKILVLGKTTKQDTAKLILEIIIVQE